MKVTLCDICGERIGNYNIRTITSLFGKHYGEVCSNCYENYRYVKDEYYREKNIIDNRYYKKLCKLDKKYKKKILELRKNS